jgi:site-specific DNA recombinase
MKAIGYFSSTSGSTSSELMESFYKYCNLNGHEPSSIFPEGQYSDMLDHIKGSNDEFVILIEGPEKLANNLEGFVDIALQLNNLNANLICLNTDNSNPFSRALEKWVTSSTAGRGERIRQAMASRAVRGDGLGKPPFGYKVSSSRRLDVNPDEADTIRIIFDLYCNKDMGMRRIVNHLNSKGLPTRTGSGWSIVTIRDILRNRAYLGTYTRFGMRVPRNHEALISAEAFNKAQENMASRRVNRSSYAHEPFIVSGISFCSSCGNKMVGVSRRQSWKRKDGSATTGKYRYYQCQSRTNQGMCRYHTWRALDLESKVIEQVYQALSSNMISIKSVAVRPSNITTKRLNSRVVRAVENLASGLISMRSFKESIGDVQGNTSGVYEDTPRGNTFPDSIDKWHSQDPDISKDILKTIIDRIDVYDDKIEISFKK